MSMIIGTLKAALIFLIHAFAYGISLGMGFWLAGKLHQRIDYYYFGLWHTDKNQFWEEIPTDSIVGAFFGQIKPFFHKANKKPEEKTVDIPV